MLSLTHHLVMLVIFLITITIITSMPQEKFAEQLLNDNYYFYEGVGYYKPHTTAKGWSDAQNSCIQEGGELLIINSVKEAAAVKMLMDIYDLEKVYSGFHSIWSDGKFVTVYGLPLKTTGYEVWSNEETNDPKSGLCGGVDSQGKLLTLPCNENTPFICEQQLCSPMASLVLTDSSQLTADGFEKPPDQIMTKYLYFQDVGYYKMYEGATGGWVGAYETCERDGAHLVIINSKKEAEVVAKIIHSYADSKNTILYVGFHMIYDTLASNPDRTFLTVQGDNVSVWICFTLMSELALTGDNMPVCLRTLRTLFVSCWQRERQSLNHSGYNIWGCERTPRENYHCGTVDREAKFDIHSCNLSIPFICEHEL
uniref:C-type lectin domain-containing protein n=1 Tax=Timema bartmani TaxID=61472 RepID=A0A7R9F9E3_9NEOP|nr:unnamed protein product [Timema bartmani]